MSFFLAGSAVSGASVWPPLLVKTVLVLVGRENQPTQKATSAIVSGSCATLGASWVASQSISSGTVGMFGVVSVYWSGAMPHADR